MKTQISITGQPAGNYRLHMHLQRDAEKVDQSYANYTLYFRTKKEARKALSQAAKNLKSLEPDFAKEGGIKYWPGWKLIYDASKAVIQ